MTGRLIRIVLISIPEFCILAVLWMLFVSQMKLTLLLKIDHGRKNGCDGDNHQQGANELVPEILHAPNATLHRNLWEHVYNQPYSTATH